MSLLAAIAQAISKDLLKKFPSAAAEEFDLDEDEFKTFLEGFLSKELPKTKGSRTSGPKGKDGKTATTGWRMFCAAKREEVKENNPDIAFGEITKKLGKMWGKIGDEGKAKWNKKAVAQNTKNGLSPKKDKAAPKKTGSSSKDKGTTKKGSSSKDKAASKKGTVKVVKHEATGKWVISGTSFVVVGFRDRSVMGRVRGNKVIKLSEKDIAKCEENGWAVAKPPAEERKTSKGKSKKQKEEEVDNDDDDDDEDDEGDEDDDDGGDDEDDEDDEDDDDNDDDEDGDGDE